MAIPNDVLLFRPIIAGPSISPILHVRTSFPLFESRLMVECVIPDYWKKIHSQIVKQITSGYYSLALLSSSFVHPYMIWEELKSRQ